MYTLGKKTKNLSYTAPKFVDPYVYMIKEVSEILELPIEIMRKLQRSII